MSSVPQTIGVTTGLIDQQEIREPQPAKVTAPPYNVGEYGDKRVPSGIGGTPVATIQPMAPRNTYTFTAPLGSLQQGPTPVDCPYCRTREMSRTEFVAGGTTQ